MTSFPTIGSYGFLSDCHTAALVTRSGAVEWMCLPRFDSPSMFGALLDRGAGSFSMAPAGVTAPLNRRYEPGTLIIETTWITPTGWAVATDALTIPARSEDRPRSEAGTPTPRSGHEADHCLLRQVTCIDGEVEVEMRCEPRPVYALGSISWSLDGVDDAIGEASARELEGAPHLSRGPARVHLASDMDLALDGPAVTGTSRLASGESAYCALAWGEAGPGPPRDSAEAGDRLTATRQFWRRWLHRGEFPDHPWRVHLQRSALVLKGLTHARTGAIVAAPTTSLPESPGGKRNWDYRYSWIRDSTFTLWAMHLLGYSEEAADYMRFTAEACSEDPDLQIMYGVGGERDLTERTLDHLSGYEGARPVRIGNAAFSQRQNDVWGALMDSCYLHSKASGSIPDSLWRLLEHQVEVAILAREHPDQGMWETRGKPRHYVSSKLMIWVAIERGARIAEQRARQSTGEADRLRRLAARWRSEAEEVKEEICERGVRDGVFRQHYDTEALDASTLLIPLLRFLPPDDRRVRDTVLTVERELQREGLVLRYRPEETDDGFDEDEGAFLSCSFWLVSALSEIGESGRARALCERLLSSAGCLDLYAEEIDGTSGRHLGNFPQGLTHLALINAVSHVIADEQRQHTGMTAVFSEIRGAASGG